MARGDSISHIATVSSGAYLELRPASGDEWMITGVGDNHLQTYIVSNGSISTFYPISGVDPYGYCANRISKYIAASGWTNHDLQWFLSNTNYMKVINDGASHIFWFMGVKVKD